MPAARTGLYVTLVTPPDGVAFDRLVNVLVEAGLSDTPTVQSVLKRVAPCILGECEIDIAERCVARITELGGDAMIVSMRDAERLGGTLRIRDLGVGAGTLDLTLWRGPTTSVRFASVDVLVRASDSRETSGGVGPSDVSRRAISGAVIRHRSAYGSLQDDLRTIAASRKKILTFDWLDIHTKDGTVYQLDGAKFGYAALGEMKTQGDRANMDKMLDLLTHLAPHAAVDTYFPLFRAPSSVKRIRLHGMRINEEDATFAFYSRWAALVYRHVIGSV